MAFIDIEAPNTDYRIIITNHKTTAEESQIPLTCTALVIEAICDDQLLRRSYLEGRYSPYQDLATIHYQKLLSYCRKKGLPLVLAEPLYTPKGVDLAQPKYYIEEQDYTAEGVDQSMTSAKTRLLSLGSKPDSIRLHSPEFELLERDTELVVSILDPII